MNVELLNKYKFIEKTDKVNKNSVNFECKYKFLTGRKIIELIK